MELKSLSSARIVGYQMENALIMVKKRFDFLGLTQQSVLREVLIGLTQ